jgi:hypothetical protein
MSEKCESELQQGRCAHRLERVDAAKEYGFRYHCIVCGAWLRRKSGVVIKSEPQVKPVKW